MNSKLKTTLTKIIIKNIQTMIQKTIAKTLLRLFDAG